MLKAKLIECPNWCGREREISYLNADVDSFKNCHQIRTTLSTAPLTSAEVCKSSVSGKVEDYLRRLPSATTTSTSSGPSCASPERVFDDINTRVPDRVRPAPKQMDSCDDNAVCACVLASTDVLCDVFCVACGVNRRRHLHFSRFYYSQCFCGLLLLIEDNRGNANV